MQYSYDAPTTYPGHAAAGNPAWQQTYNPQAAEDAAKQKRKDKKKQLKVSDTTNAVKVICVAGIVLAFLVILPCFGSSWQWVHFTGFGVSSLYVGTSLLTMEVNVDCGKNIVENQICHQFQKFEGHHGLMRSKEMACALSTGHILATPEACLMLESIVYMSFAHFVFCVFAALFNLCGSAFLYHYWFVQAWEKSRRWALICFIIAEIIIVASTVVYSSMTPNLELFPRAFGGTMYTIVGGEGIFGMKSTHKFPFGLSWFEMLFAIFVGLCNLLVWIFFFNAHEDERQVTKAEKWLKREAVETAAMIGYGTLQMEEEAQMGVDQRQQLEWQQQQAWQPQQDPAWGAPSSQPFPA